ncbi:MAG: hypothetical protein QXX41_02730 [Nitrososphaerota archaeon]
MIYTIEETVYHFVVFSLLNFVVGLGYLQFVSKFFWKGSLKVDPMICFLMGSALLINISYFLSFILLSKLTIIIFFVFLCTSIIVLQLLGRRRFDNSKCKFLRLVLFQELKKQALAITLILISFSLYVRIVYMVDFSSGIDATYHGTYVSLLLYNQHFTSSFKPIADVALNLWRYPLGFHTLSAFFSMILDLLPARSMLIIGASYLSIIPLLFYFVVKSLNKNTLLGVIAFFISFIIPIYNEPIKWSIFDLTITPLHHSLYPTITGMFLLFGLLAILVMMGSELNRNTLMLLIPTLTALFFSYPRFFIIGVTIVFLDFTFLAVKRGRAKIYYIVLLIMLVSYFLISILLQERIINFFFADVENIYSSYTSRFTLFADSTVWYYSYLLFLGVVFPFYGIFSLRRHVKGSSSLFFLTLFLSVAQILSHNKEIFHILLWFYPPHRLLASSVILSILSMLTVLYNMTATFIDSSYKKVIPQHWKKNTNLRTFMNYSLFGLLLVLLSLFPFSPVVMYNYDRDTPWAQHFPTAYKDEIYNAALWMKNNIDPNDLVINDLTPISFYITAFIPQKVVFQSELYKLVRLGYITDEKYSQMINDGIKIFQNPKNYTYLLEFAEKYDAKYLILTRQWGRVYWKARGMEMIPKNIPIVNFEEYIKIFEENPNLDLVYLNDVCAIYKIRVK